MVPQQACAWTSGLVRSGHALHLSGRGLSNGPSPVFPLPVSTFHCSYFPPSRSQRHEEGRIAPGQETGKQGPRSRQPCPLSPARTTQVTGQKASVRALALELTLATGTPARPRTQPSPAREPVFWAGWCSGSGRWLHRQATGNGSSVCFPSGPQGSAHRLHLPRAGGVCGCGAPWCDVRQVCGGQRALGRPG